MPRFVGRVVLGAAIVLAGRATAQGPGSGAPPPASRRLITPLDLHNWNQVRQTVLSNNGMWFAYAVGPTEGDVTVIYRGTARDAAESRTPAGQNGGSIAISGDSRWLGFIVTPPRPPQGHGSGRRAGPGGGGRGAGTGTADSAGASKMVLVNLATGMRKEFPRIRRFSFNTDDATWVAMQEGSPANGGGGRGAGPGGGRGGRGGFGGAGGEAQSAGSSDVLLYNLATGETFNMGRVDEYAFDRDGTWLAYTMSAPDEVGNGVQLRNMKTGVSLSLESEPLRYSQLAWVDSSAGLSVMRGRIDSLSRDTVYSIEAFTNFGVDGPGRHVVFDPTGRSDFPGGWKIASDRAPRYSAGLENVFFGIREMSKIPRNRPANAGRGTAGRSGGAPGAGGAGAIPPGGRAAAGAGATDDSIPSLILWHYKDPRLQSQQIVQEQQDRAFSFLSDYRFGDNRFVRLADDSIRTVTVTNHDAYAYGIDPEPYEERASYTGRNYQDVYAIDLKTGDRRLLQHSKPSGTMMASPDGGRVLFWGKDANWWVLDLATGDSVNVTRGVPASFVNTEDDHNNLYPPPARVLGWSSDGRFVLLSDLWDIWKVPTRPDAGTAVNLTGNGRKSQIRYQTLYRFDSRSGARGREPANPADGIDLSQPLYVGTYGEWTKKEGLSRVDPGTAGARSLFFDDAKYSILKARDAEMYLYTRQTFTAYPDYHVFGTNFAPGYAITDINPQQRELAWSSGTRLVNYTSAKGDHLQAAMYLPADYQPGKQYPMLVTIYEKRSQGKNVFVSPSATRAPDPTLYTDRGYVVLDPDIVYKVNDPGMSAVWCVVPAVKAAIATGMVDPKHVGLWGHSWGGYQTAFLVTQTDIFAAAIAGAPLTNMVSMYASIYWNSGGSDAAIFESSQGRFKGNFLDNYDAYIRNSPVFHADKVHTPLMILQNDKDGAVDFNQGVTYFNTLRQLGKPVIFLEYVGENHGLGRPVNQRDYAIRMGEFFDHYLKGAAAPDWLKNGIPRLQMEDNLIARRDSLARLLEPAANAAADGSVPVRSSGGGGGPR
ncbi:MAG: S9 family peptidase [Gemmatimonadales bacterium]